MSLSCMGCRKENHTVKDCSNPATCTCQHRQTKETDKGRKPVK